MLKRIYEKENSLAFSVEDIPNYYNYMALARCIAGIEIQGGKIVFPTIDQSCRSYSVIETNSISSYTLNRKGSKKKSKPCKAINIKTNEQRLFNSFGEAAEYFGVKQSYVSQAIKMNYKIKKEWLIKRI